MNLTRRALLLAGLVVLLGIAGQWIGPPWVGIWRYPAVLLAGLLALEALLCSRTAASAAVSLPDTAALREPPPGLLAGRAASGRPAPLGGAALGWGRVLSADGGYPPPDAPLSRGLEVHPGGSGPELEIWIDRDYVPAGYGWSFPAGDEVRVGEAMGALAGAPDAGPAAA